MIIVYILREKKLISFRVNTLFILIEIYLPEKVEINIVLVLLPMTIMYQNEFHQLFHYREHKEQK